MTKKEQILRYLQSIYPDSATNGDIREALGFTHHQDVFYSTRDLREAGIISAKQIGREWHFKAKGDKPLSDKPKMKMATAQTTGELSPKQFEMLAQQKFAVELNTPLLPGKIEGVNKEWDMLSPDSQVVGDAKYYTMVRGKGNPAAKHSTISEHVWLLEKTRARIKFLVFGNQREVPETWLRKYEDLVSDVQFYFLDDEGKITRLK